MASAAADAGRAASTGRDADASAAAGFAGEHDLLDLLAVPNTVPDNALVNRFGMKPIPFAGEHIAYLKDNTLGDTMAKFFGNATIN